jgi:predicted RNA-binding Zn-ribbon protein involved in translation (DUF1610 family)
MGDKKAQKGWISDNNLMKINEQPEAKVCPQCGGKMSPGAVSTAMDTGTGRVTNDVRRYKCPVCGHQEIVAVVNE